MVKTKELTNETPTNHKILITIACVVSFLVVSYVFFSWLRGIQVTPNIAASLSLLAGSFVAFLIMALSGLIREFSIKSPLFAMSATLEERIKNVQSEVVESKKEIGDKIFGLTQTINNVQSLVSTNTINSRVDQSTSLNLGDMVTQIADVVDSQRTRIISNAGIGKEIRPSKVSLPRGIKKNIRELDEIQGKVEELQKSVEKISHMNIEKDMQEANLYFYAGYYKEASDRYDRILNDFPNNIDALINKGIVLYRLGKYRDSQAFFEKAIENDPNNFRACIYKALVLSRFGEEEIARAFYKRATELPIYDSNIDDLVNKGIAFYRLGKNNEGDSFFDQAAHIEIDHNNVDALVNLGNAYYYQKKYEEAIKLYEKAIKNDQNNPFALYDAAASYSIQGKNTERALDLLQKLIQQYPEYKEVAKKDDDFNNIRNDERFKRIISA